MAASQLQSGRAVAASLNLQIWLVLLQLLGGDRVASVRARVDVCACADRVSSVLGLLINPWARAVLRSQTDRLSPVPASVTRTPLQQATSKGRGPAGMSGSQPGGSRRKKEQRERCRNGPGYTCLLLGLNTKRGTECLRHWSAAVVWLFRAFPRQSTSLFSLHSGVKSF